MTTEQYDSVTATKQGTGARQPQDPSRAARASRRLQALEQQVRLLSEMSDQSEARLDGISDKLDEIHRLLNRTAPAPEAGDEPVEPSDVELVTFGDSLPPDLRAVYDAVSACRHDVSDARGVIEAVRRGSAEADARLERIEAGVADSRDGLSTLADEVSSLAADVRSAAEQRVGGRGRMPQRRGPRAAQGAGMGGGAARGWGPYQLTDDGLGAAAYDELSQRVSESCDEIKSIMEASVRNIASVAVNIRDAIETMGAKALPGPPATDSGGGQAAPAWAEGVARLARQGCVLAAVAAAASAASLLLQAVG